jgi:hypothetical protein
MLELQEEADGKILVANLSGKLTKEDFRIFPPKAEQLINHHGKIRVLCRMHDFQGWELGALWEDIKFDLKHFADIERLAIVGHHKWGVGMATFCKPFTNAKVRHFDLRDSRLAEEWIRADLVRAALTGTEHSPWVRHDTVQEASEESFPASDSPAY